MCFALLPYMLGGGHVGFFFQKFELQLQFGKLNVIMQKFREISQ